MLLLLAAAEILAGTPACQSLRLQETTAGSQTYELEEGVHLVFGRDASLDTATDYGQRVLLYVAERGVFKRVYYSAGSKDSAAMTPTFIGHCGRHETLIFVDVGAEYSWGFRVFAYDERKLRDLGEIPIAVPGDPDAQSAIPFVKLIPNGETIDLTFTTDVIKDAGGKLPQSLPAHDIRYQIGAISVQAK